MDDDAYGRVLYRNDKCCDDAKTSSVCVKYTAVTEYSTSPPRFQKDLELKQSDHILKFVSACPRHEERNYSSKNQCYQYKMFLRRVKSLLDEIKAIRKNESTGICEICKRYNSIGRCKRCELLGNRYEMSKIVHIPSQLQQTQQNWQLKQQKLETQPLMKKLGVTIAADAQSQQQQMHDQRKHTQLSHSLYENKNTGNSELHHHTMQQRRFMLWLSKVKQFLFSVLETEATQHKLFHNKDTNGIDDLTNLLNELKLGLNMPEPYIRQFSQSFELLESLNDSNNIYKEVIQKLTNDKNNYSAVVASDVPCHNTCEYFAGRKLADATNLNENLESQSYSENTLKEKGKHKRLATLKTNDTKAKLNSKREPKTKGRALQIQPTDIKPNDTTVKPDSIEQPKTERIFLKKQTEKKAKERSKEADSDLHKDKKIENSNKRIKDLNPEVVGNDTIKNKSSKREKSQGGKCNRDEESLMAAILKTQQGVREKKLRNDEKVVKPPLFPVIDELPIIKQKEPVKKDIVEGTVGSESFMECNLLKIEPKQMIKGTEVVPIKPKRETEASAQPRLFNVIEGLNGEKAEHNYVSNTTTTGTTTTQSSKARNKQEITESSSTKGVISYRLSNNEFIEKGWTFLPTTTIMRKMNVYKMEPAKPQYDWFKNHINERLVFYATGEKLAEIDADGSGRWYYKNGQLALDYYSSQATHSGHRYVIYSCGEKDALRRKQPVTVLACFDYAGNGVVYDHNGNERLKYNQSEGVVIDAKIGAPGHWKWHTLNEPPVLQPQYLDTYAKRDACIDKLMNCKNADKLEADSKGTKEPDLDMIEIELENIVKEKANKLLQVYKPFQIKMKALKINDQFSLKVLDQSNIHLIFREGQTFMKLNLGMLLLSNEIVDIVVAELNQVATPYDYFPAKSQSIANIQKIVEKARNYGKTSGNKEKRT